MEKLISRRKGLSGINKQLYIFNSRVIEQSTHFIYRVVFHKYWSNGYCLLGDKFFKSDKLLCIKTDNEFRYFKGYIIRKEIVLIGAPYEFIRDNNLPLYNKIKNIKKK